MTPSEEELKKAEKEFEKREQNEKYFKETLGMDIQEDFSNIDIPLKRKEGIRINVDIVEFYNSISEEDTLVVLPSNTFIVNLSISEFEKLITPPKQEV